MGAKVTAPFKRLGAWLVRSNNTVYQAATDGFVYTYNTAIGSIVCFTDDSNPPTTIRSSNHQHLSNSNFASMSVKRNDYWKVTDSSFVWWLPLEP